jgi:hypothetical protein
MLFLAVIAAVAIRTMVPDIARVEFKAADTPASQPTFVRSFVEFIRDRGAPKSKPTRVEKRRTRSELTQASNSLTANGQSFENVELVCHAAFRGCL